MNFKHLFYLILFIFVCAAAIIIDSKYTQADGFTDTDVGMDGSSIYDDTDSRFIEVSIIRDTFTGCDYQFVNDKFISASHVEGIECDAFTEEI